MMLGVFMAQAQSKEAPLHVQSRPITDSTVMMVDAKNSNENYTSLHWNNKVFKLEKSEIEPLNEVYSPQSEGYTTLHWNNKVMRLNKLAISDTNNLFSDHTKYLSVH